MKILCISDQIDPLVYSGSIKERFKDIDLVLCAGDLAMEYVDFIVTSLNKPTYFIFGNHNLKEFCYYHPEVAHSRGMYIDEDMKMKHSHGAIYTGFNVFKEGNLLIAGASGSLRYNNGLNQYSDKEMFYRLLKMIPKLVYNKMKYGRYLDIFLTHASPLGIHDKDDPCHKGFKCYLWFLNKFTPKYMIHGHIHLYDLQAPRISTYDKTTVINAYSHYILEIEEKKLLEKN
jgi:Icc-related predicted phosphoesterase